MANNKQTPHQLHLPNILIVDDRNENLIALEALLAECNAIITTASNGNDALSLMLENEFALLLLDVQMPGMDGFEVAELMRSNAATRHIPIIFVTAINTDQKYIFKGYESGAVDYLTKPVEPFILRSKVNIFLNIWQQQHELSRAMDNLVKANQQIALQRKALQEQAIRDHLTGLYQRRWLDEVAAKEVSQAIRHNAPLSLAMVDIDHFKKVNDNHGHSTGDAVLVQLSKVLEDSVRIADTVFRFGGEEFVVLMPNTTMASASIICERVRCNVLNTLFQYDNKEHRITISIGIANLFELQNPTTKELLKHADEQLYRAKSEGRNCVIFNLN